MENSSIAPSSSANNSADPDPLAGPSLPQEAEDSHNAARVEVDSDHKELMAAFEGAERVYHEAGFCGDSTSMVTSSDL